MSMRSVAVVLVVAGCMHGDSVQRQNHDFLEELRGRVHTAACHSEQVQVTCVRTAWHWGNNDCLRADVDVCGTYGGRWEYQYREGFHASPYDFSWIQVTTNYGALRDLAAGRAYRCMSDPDHEMQRAPDFQLTCLQPGRNAQGDPDCTLGEIFACGERLRFELDPGGREPRWSQVDGH